MKFVATVMLALASTAAAFTPSAKLSSTPRPATQLSETKADLEALAKKLNPVIGFYDPLNLAEAEFWGTTNEETIGFLRHAEIKHGRVAMFAFVGYIVHANGIKFPWAMQMDGSPFPTETNPPALWDTISDAAKWQIFTVIAFLEFWSELSTPDNVHYMKGGQPGKFPEFKSGPDSGGIPHPVPFNYFDPFGLSKNKSKEAKERGLLVELNNGRLAQIGILGFLSEQTTPGSVPFLSGIVQPYSGEPMAPFTHNVIGAPFGLN